MAESTRSTAVDALPAGLRTDWPVPRIEVVGTRDGVGAHVEYWAARAALGGLSRLPTAPRELVVATIARLAQTFDRNRSEAARVFLRQAFGPDLGGPELEARVLQAWKHFLRITIESAGFARHVSMDRIAEHFTVETSPDVERLRAERRGAIFVTAHLGDWEAGSATLPWLGFDPLYVVAKPPSNKPLSQHLQRLREARGLRVLPRRGAMKHAATILAAGGSLAMVLDQRARKRPVMAPFFGRMSACDRSAGVIVRRLHAPVVIGACYRDRVPYRWRTVLTRVFEPEELRHLDPAAIATVINVELEKLIRAEPEQYFWLHDRWRGAVPQPAGAAESSGEGDEDE